MIASEFANLDRKVDQIENHLFKSQGFLFWSFPRMEVGRELVQRLYNTLWFKQRVDTRHDFVYRWLTFI